MVDLLVFVVSVYHVHLRGHESIWHVVAICNKVIEVMNMCLLCCHSMTCCTVMIEAS